MNRERVLTQEAFDGLLSWLDPNRDEAGKKYEAIRRRLIKIFTCRGCAEAEELTDETFNRVALKVETVAKDYVGDPARYFYGVAQKVYMESLRERAAPMPQPATVSSDETEIEYDCLERCMQRLPSNQREFILGYYQEDRRAKIDNRKKLAEKMGIALNALRIRAHRIRATLEECVRNCVRQRTAE